MNRRNLLTGVAAAWITLPAVAQVPRRRVFEHSELKTLWAVLNESRDLIEAQDRLRHWGPLPWTFTGTFRDGVDASRTPQFTNATVIVSGIVDDAEGRVLGMPRALVSIQVAEPISMSGPPRRLPMRYAQ